MARTIIVSDLHTDTWDDCKYGRGKQAKTKLAHWCEFLDWCEGAHVSGLIINGDFMDAPPYEGNTAFTSKITAQAFERLVTYARSHEVTYIYGNHDIGVSGIRCLAGSGVSALAHLNLVYPTWKVQTLSSVILLQHGHLYDPALVLYVRDLTTRTYLISHFQAFQWMQQRRDPETGERIAAPGVNSPSAAGAGRRDKNVYYALKLAQVNAPLSEGEVADSGSWLDALKRLKDGAVEIFRKPVTHAIWWEASKEVFRDYLDGQQQPPATLYCVMGHTHVPDTGEATISGTHCIYLNSGTWAGEGNTPRDRSFATYLDVDDVGKVWVQDWISDRWTRPAAAVAAPI